jgi:hypothetical protein
LIPMSAMTSGGWEGPISRPAIFIRTLLGEQVSQ